jgi:hypothetical protein
MAACTAPTDAPTASGSKSSITTTLGDGRVSIAAHQSVPSKYESPVIGGSEERTRHVAANPNNRLQNGVNHCRPGLVNPSFRKRTPHRSIAFAMVHVSKSRKASKLWRGMPIAGTRSAGPPLNLGVDIRRVGNSLCRAAASGAVAFLCLDHKERGDAARILPSGYFAGIQAVARRTTKWGSKGAKKPRPTVNRTGLLVST